MKTFTLSILITISLTTSYSQCNCDFSLDSTDTYMKGEWLPGLSAGDTICLGAGRYPYLKLLNIHGEENNPITIINCGGKVEIGNGTHYYGFSIENSSYIHVTGTGDNSIDYGISIDTTKNSTNGMTLTQFCTNAEVDHIEIANTGSSGLVFKTDPKCDTLTHREHFVMKGISIHDNYIHNTTHEGMYIGYYNYDTLSMYCSGQQTDVLAHSIKDIKIYNNDLVDIGWDGIQLSGADSAAAIYNNEITSYGQEEVEGQMSGIQIGGGTTGDCYNNKIIDGMGTGIFVNGSGGNHFYNNLIVNAGKDYLPNNSSKRVYGIFCDDRITWEDSSFYFHNNTIIRPKTNGIRFYSEESIDNRIHNNLIVEPGAYDEYEADPTWQDGLDAFIYMPYYLSLDVDTSNNYFSNNITDVKFTDTSTNDFSLTSTSPAIDYGLDLSSYGYNDDIDDTTRDTVFDAGCYEYVAPPMARSYSREESTTEVLSTEEEKEEVESLEVQLFPNPIRTYQGFSISANYVIESVFILDKTGQVHIAQYGLSSQRLHLGSPHLPGLYYVKITTIEGVIYKRLEVE